jgi:hypothetical protein
LSLFKRVGVVLAIVLVSLGVGATAAYAGWNSCPAGERVCTYNDTYGNGSNYNYSYNGVDNCINIGYPWNDAIRSMWNQSSHKVMFYLDANCSNGSINRWLYYPGTKEYAIGGEWSSLKWTN